MSIAIKDPFYKQVVCFKVNGGKRPLWHARRVIERTIDYRVCGAGNTADNAIRDLAAQLRNRPKGV